MTWPYFNMRLATLGGADPVDFAGHAFPQEGPPIWKPGKLYGGVHQMMPASADELGVLWVQPQGVNPGDRVLRFSCRLTIEQHNLLLAKYIPPIDMQWTWDYLAGTPAWFKVCWNPENESAYSPRPRRGDRLYLDADLELRYLEDIE